MTDSKRLRILLILAYLALASSSLLQAQTYTDLFDFDGTNHGCCSLYPGILAQGRDGNIYGVTTQGGANSRGTIFKWTLAGAVTILHSFDLTDGGGPLGRAHACRRRKLLWLCALWRHPSDSAGVIFKITPAGTYTVIHNFTRATDGEFPKMSPIVGNDGQLYGTTGVGGRSSTKLRPPAFSLRSRLSRRTVRPVDPGQRRQILRRHHRRWNRERRHCISLTSTGVQTTIFNFAAATGSQPYGPLMLSADGNFYGTTYTAGSLGGGVVYKLTPAGVYTVLHSFNNTDRSQGLNPTTGLVQGSDGFLYGVTSAGGAHLFGTIFKVKPDTTGYVDIEDLDGTHGAVPYSQPLLHTNGKIYGVTDSGGAHNDGVIYSFAVGLKPFVQPVPLRQAKVGASVGILGQNLSTATAVLFGAGAGTFTTSGNSYMVAKPATGATTGVITVDEPGGNLVSPQKFKIVPTIISFTPPSGAVGTSVVLTGTSFTQAVSGEIRNQDRNFHGATPTRRSRQPFPQEPSLGKSQ